jgi:WD40 repeat protein
MQHLKQLSYHADWVNDILLHDGNLISCSSDCNIVYWKDSLASTIGRHSDAVRRISLLGDKLVSGGLDREIKTWDMSMMKPLSCFYI